MKKQDKLFETQDDTDKRSADSIEEIECLLESKTVVETSFTLRWVLDGDDTGR